jgi:hypothetical protein
MRLIGLVVVLPGGLVLSPLAGEAQQARKPVRIGVLTAQSRETSTASWESFRQGLRDLGWEEREGTSSLRLGSPTANLTGSLPSLKNCCTSM